MSKRNGLLFKVVLMPIVMSCCVSCMPANYEPVCPVYPVAGSAVAIELEKAGDMPATFEWIGRINKLRQELEVCR